MNFEKSPIGVFVAGGVPMTGLSVVAMVGFRGAKLYVVAPCEFNPVDCCHTSGKSGALGVELAKVPHTGCS